MTNIGNYAAHARFWDWGGHDRSCEHEHWLQYAKKYGNTALSPMCAWGETAAYMATRGMVAIGLDGTPEMVNQGIARFAHIPGFHIYEGDIRNFKLNIPPIDFCFCVDFGHLQNMDEIASAISCINRHMRVGGGFVIEAGIRLQSDTTADFPKQTFHPQTQIYPDMHVWKISRNRYDAKLARRYISQIFFAKHADGSIESFDHDFYLQEYYQEQWLEMLADCGFVIKGEFTDRNGTSWNGEKSWIVEAVKV